MRTETGGDVSAEPVRNPTSLLNVYDATLGMTFSAVVWWHSVVIERF